MCGTGLLLAWLMRVRLRSPACLPACRLLVLLQAMRFTGLGVGVNESLKEYVHNLNIDPVARYRHKVTKAGSRQRGWAS